MDLYRHTHPHKKCSSRYNTKIDTQIYRCGQQYHDMLTKQTKQPQRPPGVLFPPPWEPVLVLSPPRSALCLNPETGLGVRVSSLDRGGSPAHRPQAAPSAMSAISSPPFLPSSSLRLPPRRPPPHSSPSTGRGAHKEGLRVWAGRPRPTH